MNDKLKRIFKKFITPAFLTLLYITAVAVLAYFADKETNGGLLDFDYATSFVIFLIWKSSCNKIFGSGKRRMIDLFLLTDL